jgi:hypothetical protein
MLTFGTTKLTDWRLVWTDCVPGTPTYNRATFPVLLHSWCAVLTVTWRKATSRILWWRISLVSFDSRHVSWDLSYGGSRSRFGYSLSWHICWCPSVFSIALFIQFLMLTTLSAREQKDIPFQLSPIGGVASIKSNKAHMRLYWLFWFSFR